MSKKKNHSHCISISILCYLAQIGIIEQLSPCKHPLTSDFSSYEKNYPHVYNQPLLVMHSAIDTLAQS